MFYLAARLAMALITIAAALWLRLPAFCLLYTLYYLVMGCQDTMDAVLLQSNARDEMRGTLMSVQSFALRLGGLASQLLSAAVPGVSGNSRTVAAPCSGVSAGQRFLRNLLSKPDGKSAQKMKWRLCIREKTAKKR